MKIEFDREKEIPTTKVVTSISAECKETEKGFLFPISVATPSGSVLATAIECEILGCESGVLRMAVKSANYNNGELTTEPALLNHVLVDLKQSIPACNDSELVIPPPVFSKTKSTTANQ